MGTFSCKKCGKYGLMPICQLCDVCIEIENSIRDKKHIESFNKIVLQNIQKLNDNPHKLNKIIALLMVINNIQFED